MIPLITPPHFSHSPLRYILLGPDKPWVQGWGPKGNFSGGKIAQKTQSASQGPPSKWVGISTSISRETPRFPGTTRRGHDVGTSRKQKWVDPTETRLS